MSIKTVSYFTLFSWHKGSPIVRGKNDESIVANSDFDDGGKDVANRNVKFSYRISVCAI